MKEPEYLKMTDMSRADSARWTGDPRSRIGLPERPAGAAELRGLEMREPGLEHHIRTNRRS